MCMFACVCACVGVEGGYECARTDTHICVCLSDSRDLVRYKLGRGDVSHGELLCTIPSM